MKKFILILAVAFLCAISAFSQTVYTEIHVQDLLATEFITGKLKVVPNTNATVALTVDSCLNIVHMNADADVIEYDLPVSERGLVTGFGDIAGGVITVDPNGSEYILINGASAGAGVAIVSDGAINDYVILIGLGGGAWFALPTSTFN